MFKFSVEKAIFNKTVKFDASIFRYNIYQPKT